MINKNNNVIQQNKSMKKQFPKSINKSFRLKTTQQSTQKIQQNKKLERRVTDKVNLMSKTNGANSSIPALNNNNIGDQKSIYFHPDIYHKPEERKKYFCQLVDSYMKNRTGKDDKTLKLKKKIKQEQQIPQNYDIGSSNFCNQQINSQANSPDNSPLRRVKLKRAMTAGHTREKTQQASIKLEKVTNYNDDTTKIQKSTVIVTPNKQTKYELDNSKVREIDPESANPKIKYLNKILRLKNQMNHSKRYKNIEMRNNENSGESRNVRKFNPESELNNSISNQSLSQPSDGEQGNRTDKKNETKHTADFSGIANKTSKILKTVHKNSATKSRMKTLSQISLSASSYKINKRKHEKTVRLQQCYGRQQQLKLFQIVLRQQILKFSPQYKKEWKIKYLYQHQLFEMFYLQNQHKQKLKVKRFNVSQTGEKLKNAIEKVKQVGVSHMWSKLPKADQLQKQKQQLYLSPSAKPLRQQLFNFIKQQKNSDQHNPIFNIQPKSAYYDLFHNNCEQFRDIIVCIAEDLIKMDGKLINNKISLDNIYRLQQKSIKVGDWGCSALSRTIIVAGKAVKFKDQPTLTYQFIEDEQRDLSINKWLLQPQNLPPQIINCLIEGSYSNVWQIESCPQIWSLGIMIFELLTFVPVWMPYKSIVNHGIPKRGFLFDEKKRLNQIYNQQLKIPILAAKWIREQRNSQLFRNIHPEIVNLMKSMLQLNTKLRPKPIDIITKLQNII